MACTASIPDGAVSLQLPGDPETGEVGYREEVHHPALSFPKVATGTLSLRGDGTLIRRQDTPEVEIVEIGETVLRVRKGEDSEPNMLPIPERMKSLFGFLRNTVSSAERTVDMNGDAERTPDAAGWRVPFGTYVDDTSIWLLACDARLVGFLVRNGDGIERRTLFEPTAGSAE